MAVNSSVRENGCLNEILTYLSKNVTLSLFLQKERARERETKKERDEE